MSNSVVVNSVNNTVAVTENSGSAVVTVPQTSVVTAVTQGPQGATGSAGIVVDETAKVDKSVVYYDATAGQYKADAIWTTTTLTDGGNF